MVKIRPQPNSMKYLRRCLLYIDPSVQAQEVPDKALEPSMVVLAYKVSLVEPLGPKCNAGTTQYKALRKRAAIVYYEGTTQSNHRVSTVFNDHVLECNFKCDA